MEENLKWMTNKNVSVLDSAGNTVTEPEEVRGTWRQYIESWYDKDGKPKIEDLQIHEREEVDEDEAGPELLKSEMLWATSEVKEAWSGWNSIKNDKKPRREINTGAL